MDKRLQTVKQYLQLHLDREEQLKELVFLASQICQTPIASITLVDDKKQYPVIEVGNMIQTSCEVAFCNYTIKQETILVVPDTEKDPRFENNPLVTGNLSIRFYAGVPLIAANGYTIGSLCVIDKQPKNLTPGQVKSLEIIANQVMQRLELNRNIQDVKDAITLIESKKELLEQAEVMKTAFYDGCDDYFLLLNPNFEIVSFNNSINTFVTKGIHNYKLVIGNSALDYLQDKEFNKIPQILNDAKNGRTTTFDIVTVDTFQNQSWSKFTISPSYNNNKQIIGIACIGCNIDKDKKQEEKIQVQKQTLKQIAQLHSHEIRHPLTNILSIINLIKFDDFKMTEEYVTYLESASMELDEVIQKVVLDSYYAA